MESLVIKKSRKKTTTDKTIDDDDDRKIEKNKNKKEKVEKKQNDKKKACKDNIIVEVDVAAAAAAAAKNNVVEKEEKEKENKCIFPAKLLYIHEMVNQKLHSFYNANKVPHLLFHGPSGSGKHTLLHNFIQLIYNSNKELIQKYVMYVNCSHQGKGIKFIRENIKFFAKTQIHQSMPVTNKNIFKSIILFNADKLTTDAQSALRRCIELFSHSTRFFIIVEDRFMLLRPILSRFCEIHVPTPFIRDCNINLHKFSLQVTFQMNRVYSQRFDFLRSILHQWKPTSIIHCLEMAQYLYLKAYNFFDLQLYIQQHHHDKIDLLVMLQKIRSTFRKEEIIILFALHFLYLDPHMSIENISFV